MARKDGDREDVFQEATALVERSEYAMPGQAQRVVAGFRGDGALSVFFGEDPVLQLNSGGSLRRAYVQGQLVKAEGGVLIALHRDRGAMSTSLVRESWDPQRQQSFLEDCRARLLHLRQVIQDGRAKLLRCEPGSGPVSDRLVAFLQPLEQRALAAAERANVE